ncbi:MAG: hypothetical protein KDA24_14675 [Deltaproteobacteria bacterium]|nr:hypothetical protein [Deltaproteobacteria bacterium]
MRRWTLSLLSVLALTGCGVSEKAPPVRDGELGFLRGAILAPAGSGGRPVGGGRELVDGGWTPGEQLSLGGVRDQAPATAECLALFSVELGDVGRMIAMGGEAPNTALAWSPDGDQLAVGTHRGEVVLLDGWTGKELGRRRLAETMVKAVAWSPDGATLYAAEQSPDAFVHALDPPALTSRWTFRLADELDSSPAPPDTDVYGVYTLPAAWSVQVLKGGDVLVAGTHSWLVDDVRQNKARIWRLAPDGSVRDAWPEDGVADATLLFPHVDESADRLVVAVGRSAPGEPPPGLAVGGVQVLTLSTLTSTHQLVAEPLKPHFSSARPWEAVDVLANIVMAGYSDGRARLFSMDGGPAKTLELGVPWLAGDVPLAAPVSWGFMTQPGLVVTVTGDTNIPWGSQTTVTRPPSPHPQANRLSVHDVGGELAWARSDERILAGVSPSPSGRHLVVGHGERSSDDRRDLFGVSIYTLGLEGTFEEPLQVRCPTESPVFFRQSLRDDGRVAVTEVPWKAEDGSVLGTYQVTVLR